MTPDKDTGQAASKSTTASADEIVARTFEAYEHYMSPGMARLLRFMGLSAVEWEGDGAVVRDVAGNEYLDCGSGYGVLSHGHRHPRVVAAVEQQLGRMAMSTRLLISQPTVELAALLAQVTPGDLQYTFFCNSGAEAVEGALKFARIATGRSRIVAAEGAFHGKTLGALSASGRPLYKRPFEPLVAGFTHVAYGDADALAAAVSRDVAAVILEPIQGEGGVIIPPPDYLARARQACDAHDALLIIDEVQTGLGRTGRMLACEEAGIIPDMVCLAKALGGGIMPIGAIVARPRVWGFFEENPYLHSSTFGGNPLACAAGVAAIKVLLEEDLCRRAREQGERLRHGLEALQQRFPDVLRAVRGRGLLWGLELSSDGAGGMLMAEMLGRGILVIYSLNNERVIRLMPPLTVSTQQVDRVIEALGAACEAISQVVAEL